jgi:hypothetical protein
MDDIVTEDTNRAYHAMEKRVFESCETGLKQDSDMAGHVGTNTSAIVTNTIGMMEMNSQAGTGAEEPRGTEEEFFLAHSQPPTGTENAKEDDQRPKRIERVKMQHTSVSRRQVEATGPREDFPGLPRVESTSRTPFRFPSPVKTAHRNNADKGACSQ